MSYAIDISAKENLVATGAGKHNFEKNDFTIQCWINSNDAGPIIASANLSLIFQPNGGLQFTAGYQDEQITLQTERSGLNDGQWHHFTAVKSGDQLSLYLNGKILAVHESRTPKKATKRKALTIGREEEGPQLSGQLGTMTIWKKALSPQQIEDYFIEPATGQEKGLLSHFPAPKKVKDTGFKYSGPTKPMGPLKVSLTLKNDTDRPLKKLKIKKPNLYHKDFPDAIPANDFVEVVLENTSTPWSVIRCQVEYENAVGGVEIDLIKTHNPYDSGIVARVHKDLVSQLNIQHNDKDDLVADLLLAESMVVVNMRNVYNFLNALRGKLNRDQIDAGGGNLIDMIRYNEACQIFNRKFQLKPFVIVYVESTEQVQLVYNTARENNLPIRVRSGGHDHEGECSGNNTILIDMSRINHVKFTKGSRKGSPTYAHIGPGIRFIQLTTILANNNVMIPHGTCATVGIAGFTLGGGWGPWTRIAGMCCERLAGATIVLGNGEIVELDARDGKQVPDLLWALRGGGGMSYGIVTELVIETFPLPPKLIKFDLVWNPYPTKKRSPKKTPTLDVLKSWERAIKSPNTKKLIGTNLKITAIHWPYDNYDKFDEHKVTHNCVMYGYWQGDEKSLQKFIDTAFKSAKPAEINIEGKGGRRRKYGSNLMSSWDRESFYNVKRTARGLTGKPLPPDLDAPAPHKITSRLVEPQGLKKEGYRAFLKSLTSPLVLENNRLLGLFNYVTLGAITGDFYQNISAKAKKNSAFPYKEMLYTIQYQTWWNETLEEKEEGQENPVWVNTNRALDWMQVCRNFKIPNTSGAFISFKDSSIPTKTYFAQHYDRLKKIKETYSKDPLNHFRTRKTII